MIIGGEMPEELKQFLCKLLHGEDGERNNWPQVTKLTPEDLLKFRHRQASSAFVARQIKKLILQMKELEAKNEVAGAEWWDYLHKTYELASDKNYTLTEDGRILMKTRGKD